MINELFKYKVWAINESIMTSDILNSLDILKKYLNKKTGKNIEYMGKFENIIQDGVKLKGIRFVTNELDVFRLNWESNDNVKSSKIQSIDFWYENNNIPTYKILTQDKNIVQIASLLVVELTSKKDVSYNTPEFYVNVAMNLDLFNYDTNNSGIIDMDTQPMSEALTSDEMKEYGELLNKFRSTNNTDNLSPSDRERLAYFKLKEINLHDMLDMKFIKQDVKSEKNIDTGVVDIDLDTKSVDGGVTQMFNRLRQLVEMIAIGIGNSLIITGTPGVGKTYNVEKVLKDYGYVENEDYITITGTATAKGLYQSLYQSKDGMLLIFDDCDDVFKDLTTINILKGALDTKDVRSVSWLSQNTFNPSDYTPAEQKNMILKGRYPNKFDLTSRIIFITNIRNSDISNNRHLQAILTRSKVAELELTDSDVLELVKSNIERVDIGMSMEEKLEVYDVMLDAVNKKTLHNEISFRTFLMMCDAKKYFKSVDPNDTTGKWIKFAQTIS